MARLTQAAASTPPDSGGDGLRRTVSRHGGVLR